MNRKPNLTKKSNNNSKKISNKTKNKSFSINKNRLKHFKSINTMMHELRKIYFFPKKKC